MKKITLHKNNITLEPHLVNLSKYQIKTMDEFENRKYYVIFVFVWISHHG